MYHVYVLESLKHGGLYYGHSSHLLLRLEQHNSGMSNFTRAGRPWHVIHVEAYTSRSAAIRRERYLKSLKSKKAVLRMIAELPEYS